jgi:hypothetical protein
MAEHELCIGETDEWYTPPEIFDALGATSIMGAGNQEQMTEALGEIQRTVEEAEADRAAKINECWVAKCPKDGIPADMPRPWMHPDRWQMLRIVARGCGGKG